MCYKDKQTEIKEAPVENVDYRLKLITLDDVDYVAEALSDPEFKRLIRGPDFPKVTPVGVRFEIEKSPGAWWIIYDEERRVGWVRLTPFSVWNAGLGIGFVEEEDRNKGWGYAVCKDVLNLMALPLYREIYWFTWLYNHASLKLANKLGFDPLSVTDQRITLVKRREDWKKGKLEE